jgi:hypothetical protein
VVLLVATIFWVCTGWPVSAQVPSLALEQEHAAELFFRARALGLLGQGPVSALPLAPQRVARLALQLARDSLLFAPDDRYRLQRLLGETQGPDWGRLRDKLPLWKDGANLATWEGSNYRVAANFCADEALGMQFSDEGGALRYRAGRGLRADGRLGRHIFFQTCAQKVLETPLEPSTLVGVSAPGLTHVRYEPGASAVGDSLVYSQSGDVWDYLLSEATIGASFSAVDVSMGRQRQHWGPGAYSLWMDGEAPPFDYFRISAYAGPFTLEHMVTRFDDVSSLDGQTLPRKHGVFSQITWDISPRVSLQLFQATLVSPDSTGNTRPGVDLVHFIPLLDLRTVERPYGSFGNKMIGLSGTVIPRLGLRLHGSVLLTEFVASQFFSRRDFWGNKWGASAGLDWMPPRSAWRLTTGVHAVRPYTFSHRQGRTAYSHYGDPIADPVGQNVVAFYAGASKRAGRLSTLDLGVELVVRGTDDGGVNNGATIDTPYTTTAFDKSVAKSR